MKNLFLISLLSLFLYSCDVDVENNAKEQKTPIYEEFTVDDNNLPDPKVDIKEEEAPTKTESKIYEFSDENLNEYLASPEQTVVFSFKAENGKVLSLLTDSEENYLIYRFGKPEKVDFRYPEVVDNSSWEHFTYEAYKTPVLDLMHISFVNVDYEYTIYYNTFSDTPTDNKIGVQVKSLNSGKVTDIRGSFENTKGSLSFFKTNNKVTFFK